MEPEKLDRLLSRHYAVERPALEQRTRGPECPGLPVLRSVALGEPVPQPTTDHLNRCEACIRTVALFKAEIAPRPAIDGSRRGLGALAGAVAVAVVLFALTRSGTVLPPRMARAPSIEEEMRL